MGDLSVMGRGALIDATIKISITHTCFLACLVGVSCAFLVGWWWWWLFDLSCILLLDPSQGVLGFPTTISQRLKLWGRHLMTDSSCPGLFIQKTKIKNAKLIPELIVGD
jgi:hypothetical protein